MTTLHGLNRALFQGLWVSSNSPWPGFLSIPSPARTFPASIGYQLLEDGVDLVLFDPVDRRRYVFDAEGRCSLIRDPHGNTHTVAYSDSGDGPLPVSVTDGLGRQITFTYDSMQRVTSVRNGRGDLVQYEYDARVRPRLPDRMGIPSRETLQGPTEIRFGKPGLDRRGGGPDRDLGSVRRAG